MQQLMREEEDDESEGEEEDTEAAERTIVRPLEETLPDLPFKLFPLSTKPPEPAGSRPTLRSLAAQLVRYRAGQLIGMHGPARSVSSIQRQQGHARSRDGW